MRVTGFSWLKLNRAGEDATPAAQGGIVISALGAAALNVGDVVFFSAADTVNKSTTATNYAGFAGVVRGGDATNGLVSNTVGALACSGAGRPVLVQISGVATVPVTGAVTVGTNFSVIPSTATAGAVAAGTTAGQIVGTTITTATGGLMKILINHR